MYRRRCHFTICTNISRRKIRSNNTPIWCIIRDICRTIIRKCLSCNFLFPIIILMICNMVRFIYCHMTIPTGIHQNIAFLWLCSLYPCPSARKLIRCIIASISSNLCNPLKNYNMPESNPRIGHRKHHPHQSNYPLVISPN